MKNLFLLLAVVLTLVSCSSDNDNNSDSSAYNPPSWIQGTWGLEADQFSPEQPFYRFTSNNVCQMQPGVTELCWKEIIEFQPEVYSGSDSSSSTTYQASLITANGVPTITLKFQKVSASIILWVETSSGDIELTKLD
ncbi:MAG: hypothetical protein KDC90_06410 [Ignavibacteriae bacterium]|nr:hypothetical protein [Ignavibacteriota bacterium]